MSFNNDAVTNNTNYEHECSSSQADQPSSCAENARTGVNTTPRGKKSILVVTGDLPSHPYAAAKLAKVLAKAGHSVTLAAPRGPAFDRIVSETSTSTTQSPSNNNNNDDDDDNNDDKNNIRCITVGTVTPTEKHFNERPVVDPHSWSALFEALWNPFPVAQACVEILFERQDGMYEAIKWQLQHGNYDLAIAMHSTATTVCDAFEALQQEHDVAKSSSPPPPPVVIFSSMPYDPAIYLGERKAWFLPRTLTTFPHVATYSAKTPSNPLARAIQYFWMAFDALLTARAWRKSAAYNNQRRARRGLPAMYDGWRGYLQSYPILSVGGVPPFFPKSTSTDDSSSNGNQESSYIAPHVTVVGTLEETSTTSGNITGELKEWLDNNSNSNGSNGIVYVGFGTGTVLSEKEAAAITGGLLHHNGGRRRSSTNDNTQPQQKSLPPILFALRPSEQKRLRPVMDEAVGSPPTSESDAHLEYLNGRLRIQANVPQAALLQSGHVKLFVSHMGMGGTTEGVQGGVPFVAYPSGCDQYYNAQRAVDAGIAIQVSKHELDSSTIGNIVQDALANDELARRAKSASNQLRQVHGEERALDLVDSVVARAKFVQEPRVPVLAPAPAPLQVVADDVAAAADAVDSVLVEGECSEESSETDKNNQHVCFRPNVSLIVDKQQSAMLLRRSSSTAEAA